MTRRITRAARVIYRAAFNGDQLPKGWIVTMTDQQFNREGRLRVGRSNLRGLCVWFEYAILIASPQSRPRDERFNWLRTLIHEFVHQRCPRLRHGKEFEALVEAALARVWS